MWDGAGGRGREGGGKKANLFLTSASALLGAGASVGAGPDLVISSPSESASQTAPTPSTIIYNNITNMEMLQMEHKSVPATVQF